MNFGKIERIILFGGGLLLAKFALDIKNHNIELVVCSSNRLLVEKIEENITLQQFLQKTNIQYLISENISQENDLSKKINDNTLGVSFGAPWVFKKDFIDKFDGKLINCHGTRLPQNKGGGGFSWQILRDNRLGYSILHQIDEGIDTGNIISYKEFYYPKSCRIPKDYENIYIENTIEFLNDFLRGVIDKKYFEPMKQQDYFSIYWPRLFTKIHGYIDWSWKINEIEKFICAFDDPYSGASTFLLGKKVFIKNVFSDYNDGSFHPFQSGIIYRKSSNSIFVASVGGSLIVNSVCDLDNNNILNSLREGDRFYTPIENLEKARFYRAIYTPNGLKDEKLIEKLKNE